MHVCVCARMRIFVCIGAVQAPCRPLPVWNCLGRLELVSLGGPPQWQRYSPKILKSYESQASLRTSSMISKQRRSKQLELCLEAFKAYSCHRLAGHVEQPRLKYLAYPTSTQS